MQKNRLFRVGIIDSDEEYTERIINAFDCVPFVEIVFVMHTGNEVLQEIVRNYPDLIILNDVLPYNDGIEILRSIEESGIRKPYIIFTSNIQSNVFINRAVVLGINEYMLKPYRAESLVRRVRMVYRSMTGEDEIDYVLTQDPMMLREDNVLYRENGLFSRRRIIDNKLTESIGNMLIHVGIPLKQKGFMFAVSAVRTTYLLRNRPFYMSKDIYPAVAREFNVSSNVIEHNIRNVIKEAWSRFVNGEVLLDEFYNGFKQRPSNSEFLQMAAFYVQMEMNDFEAALLRN